MVIRGKSYVDTRTAERAAAPLLPNSVRLMHLQVAAALSTSSFSWNLKERSCAFHHRLALTTRQQESARSALRQIPSEMNIQNKAVYRLYMSSKLLHHYWFGDSP